MGAQEHFSKFYWGQNVWGGAAVLVVGEYLKENVLLDGLECPLGDFCFEPGGQATAVLLVAFGRRAAIGPLTAPAGPGYPGGCLGVKIHLDCGGHCGRAEVEGVEGAPIYDLVGVAFQAAKHAFIQLLYRKERGKFCSIISRFDVREEVVTKLFISRFEGGLRVTGHGVPD